MGPNLQSIKNILRASNLSDEDRVELELLFSRAQDADLEPVAKLFVEDAGWIEKINANYKAKQKAMNDKSLDSWQKIVEEELTQLEGLEN